MDNNTETPLEFIDRRFVDADGNIKWDEQFKNYLSQQLKPKLCDHEWVSSVAYKGAKICTKCRIIK